MQTALDIAILRARCARPIATRQLPPKLSIVELKPEPIPLIPEPLPIPPPSPPLNKVEHVIKAACLHFGILRAVLCGDRRTVDVVYPRQVAMYVAHKLKLASFPQIGMRFGGRDHTTVLHACSKMQRLQSDPRVATDCEAIARAVGGVV